MHTLAPDVASGFARMVLAGIHREYPNKLDHVLNDEDSVQSPRRLHPAFFGCFDWHSAVHGHWLLARLLRLFPGLPEAARIRQAMDTSLTRENIAVEAAYLARPNSGSFERTYGWAWLLKLAQELDRGAEPHWAEAIRPLAAAFVGRYLDYLPKAGYPIRAGVHANTAFGLAFARDYADAAGVAPLRALIDTRGAEFFGADRDYPAHLEPGGADFFSPALLEADLMRRLLPAPRFARWFGAFLPRGLPPSLAEPARVSDRSDLQIVHLDGLNLGRAWCLRALSRTMNDEGLARAADRHLDAAVPHACSGHYGGEHWLATFAVLALTGDG
jgi:hypothetical protein